MSKTTFHKIAACLCWLAPQAAEAALPPRLERMNELLGILGDASITDKFEEPIVRIEVMEDGRYRVSSARCHVDVTIRVVQSPIPAPGSVPTVREPGPLSCRR